MANDQAPHDGADVVPMAAEDREVTNPPESRAPATLKVSLDSPGGLLGGGRAALGAALEAPRLKLSYGGGLRQKPVPALDGTFDLSIPSVGKLAAWLKRPLEAGRPDPGALNGSWDKPEIGVDWKSVFTEAALDPKRLTNMPDDLRNFGTSLGVKLPLPGLPTGTAETGGTGGTGGVLGGVLKMIPGVSGGQPPQPEPPQAQPQQEPPPPQEEQAPSGFNPLESLKSLFGK